MASKEIRLNFDYWKSFATLRVWEVAAMMQGIDPNNIQDIVDKNGDGPDLSYEERMLASALNAGIILSAPHGVVPTGTTEIVVEGLLLWLRTHGHSDLAAGLERGPGGVASLMKPAIALPDPVRRLAALRALGGQAKWKVRNGVQKWTFTKIGALVNDENTASRPRSDEKTIRKDLVEAAEDERSAERSGRLPVQFP